MTAGGLLAGKTVLVTGAARGIGEAVVRRCADEGASTVLVDLDAGVRDVSDAVDGLAFIGDVRDRSFAQRTVRVAADRFGGLHGLANVAGVQRSGDVVSMSPQDWELVLAVNLTAPFLWTQCAIPVLLDSGGGSIVNVASIAATHAIRNSAAYVASKHGLLGLTRSVSTDFGRAGIRCNAVSPGSIETELLRDYVATNPEAGRRLVDANFTGRLGQPSEIAGWCAYLLGDAAGFMNGSHIVVDGGRTAAT